MGQYGFSGAMVILAGIWTHGLLVPFCAWELPASETQLDDPDLMMPTGGEMMPLLNRDQPERDYVGRQTIKQMLESCRSGFAFWCNAKLLITLLTLYCGMFSYYNIFFVLPPMGQELGMSKISISLLLAIMSVVEIIGRVFAGGLADRCKVQKETYLIITYIICVILGVVTSYVLNPNTLFVYGILFGSVGGTCVMWCVPMIMDLVEADQKGTATGMFPFLAGLSTGLGPIVIGMYELITL